jgi:hypothetical protein
VLSSNERRVLNSFIGSECTILDLTDALLDYQVRLGSVEITCVRPGKLHGRAKDSMLPLADLTPLFLCKKEKGVDACDGTEQQRPPEARSVQQTTRVPCVEILGR